MSRLPAELGDKLVRGADSGGRRRKPEDDRHVNGPFSHRRVEICCGQIRVVITISGLPMILELVAPVLGFQAVRMDIDDQVASPLVLFRADDCCFKSLMRLDAAGYIWQGVPC